MSDIAKFTNDTEKDLLRARWEHFRRAREALEITFAAFFAARGQAEWEVEDVTEEGVVTKAHDA